MATKTLTVRCFDCKDKMPESEVALRKRKGAQVPVCQKCRDLWRKYVMEKKYGLTLDDFYRMLRDQRDSCAICRKPRRPEEKSFCIDHCHKTGKVRGILCPQCNFILGQMGDTLDAVMRFVDYLKRSVGELWTKPITRTPTIKRTNFVRYFDKDGKRVNKGTPGATPMKTVTPHYFVRIGSKKISLETADKNEAKKRLLRMIGALPYYGQELPVRFEDVDASCCNKTASD